MKSGYFKTKFRLETAIENADKIDGMENYLDMNFAYLEFGLDSGSIPTWNEALNGELFPPAYHMLEGLIDYSICGNYDYNPETLMCEYRDGYHEPLGNLLEVGGIWYRYIASISCSEEMHHQAGNGDFACEYRGFSFVRILEPISETLQDEYPTHYGSVSLIEQILED